MLVALADEVVEVLADEVLVVLADEVANAVVLLDVEVLVVLDSYTAILLPLPQSCVASFAQTMLQSELASRTAELPSVWPQ